MISSVISRASFNRFTSVGYAILAGAQVASNNRVPSFSSLSRGDGSSGGAVLFVVFGAKMISGHL
jgi:hypothetical protein